MLENLPDEKLRALAQVVIPGFAPSIAGPVQREPGPWLTPYLRVFVSHTHEHRARVGRLKQQLERRGIECFVAHADITPSDEWRDAILEALETCEALLVWLTPDLHASDWTDQEIGHGLARRTPILTVRFEGTRLHGYLERFQALDGETISDTDLPHVLCRAFATSSSTADRLAESVAAAFSVSPSFGDTRMLIDVADLVPRFRPEHLDRMEAAARDNHEVRDYGYVARLTRLIARHRGQ